MNNPFRPHMAFLLKIPAVSLHLNKAAPPWPWGSMQSEYTAAGRMQAHGTLRRQPGKYCGCIRPYGILRYIISI